MTVPNVLTILRMLMALAAGVMFAATYAERLAATLCVSAALLDAFDGWYARKFAQCSDLGERLDPLADKIVIAVIYTVIAVKMGSVLIWVLWGFIFLREVVITLIRDFALRRQGLLIASSRAGKWKMVVQCVTGCGIMIYAYFIGRGFSISPYLVAAALTLILVLAYVSAHQYLSTLRAMKEGSQTTSNARFVERSGDSRKLAVGK